MLAVIERTLESSISPMSNTKPCKRTNKQGTHDGGAAINPDVSPFSQIIPFLGQGFCWFLIDRRLCGRVSATHRSQSRENAAQNLV